MIHYLYDKITEIPDNNKFYLKGMWSWISAFFFDNVCPLKENGSRDPGADDRHLLNSEHWGRYYRHLIAAPVRVLHDLGELADIYLTGKPNQHGDLFEQLASRQEIATNKGVIQAATILYWDSEKKKIKRGARAKNGP